MAQRRDYSREYARRLELGRQRGYSRQVARGYHPAEGGRLPDGSKASVISVREITSGRLRVATLETLHRMNAGLRGPHQDLWLAAARVRGWAVTANRRGGWSTQDDVPSAVIEGLQHRERQYFYGY